MAETLGVADALSEQVIAENQEDEAPLAPVININNIVKDSEEMMEMATRLSKDTEDEEAAGTLIDLVSPYMELPTLLDPILGKLMKILTDTCIANFGKPFPDMVYMCIYTLSNIRGFREILPLFPNQVELFEPVTNEFCKDIEGWEVKYVLCLWLSQLSLVPFDISTIGADLASRLITWGTKLLSSPTRDSEAVAFFLSRFLHRKDMTENRFKFLDDAIAHLNDPSERLVTNYLRTMFCIFNGADRAWVPKYGQKVVDAMAPLAESPSAHHRLYHIKIVQQIGIAYLPPRVAAWRYQRGSRNLKIGSSVQTSEPTQTAQEDEMYKNEDNFYVEPIVEDILALLFESLKSHLTVVRWSASKGVGRIVERLPFDDAMQAVEYLFSLFDQMDNDNLIHGACLCLAQFTLRGIILPSNLPSILPIVLKALVYDESTSSHTVAEGVRDSGCFVCWALARSYDGPTLEQYCGDIAQQLVNVFLFDRCVNVRRSASAAFQENVGRHGRFPHGLELIHIADFLTVSSRVGCFTRIAKFVAQFPEYGPSMVSYLVSDRLKHWDEEIRLLAARCLAIFAKDFPDLITADTIDEICVSCCAIDVDVKHGGLEALGNILQVRKLDQDTIESLLTLDENYQIDTIKCSFIKMVAAAMRQGITVPNFSQLMSTWLQTGTDLVQAAVVAALNYLNEETDHHVLDDQFFEVLLGQLSNPGVASAISSFPRWFVEPHISTIVEKAKEVFGNKESNILTKSNFMGSVVSISAFCDDATIVQLLALGMNDRTVTKKGDEGSHVRTAALKAASTLLETRPIGTSIVCDVVKLCLDRISGLREIALDVLRLLVEKTEDLPHRAELQKVLGEKNCNVEHFNQLIDVPEFSTIVVEGLILCSGAFAPDLSKRSRQSLLSFMRKKDGVNANTVANVIIQLYRKQWGIAIFAQALFNFMPLFVGNSLKGENLKTFANEFLAITEAKYLNKKTYQKLLRLSKVLSAFAAMCDGETQRKAFELFAPLFVCEFANIRQTSSSELFTCLKNRSIGGGLPFSFDEASEILMSTNWKDDFDAAAAGITKLCGLYGVPVPHIEKKEDIKEEKNEYSYRLLAKNMY